MNIHADRSSLCLFGICLGFLSIAAVGGCGRNETAGHEKRSSGESSRPAVKIAVVEQSSVVEPITFSGFLEPMHRAALGPVQQVRVNRILVEVGDQVCAGQELALMDDGELATLAARFQPVKMQYDRALRLFANQAMTKVDFELIESQYTAMKREVDRLQENISIKAPFAGVITDRSVEEREVYDPRAAPGRTSGILELTQLDPLKLDIEVDEHQVIQLSKGMQATLSLDVFPDTQFAGTVRFINPAANDLTRTFLVRIAVPNHNRLLRAGYSAHAAIQTGNSHAVLTIPEAAVVKDRILVVADGMAVARRVVVASRRNGKAVVSSGVSRGDQVVVSGSVGLPDSCLVQIVR